MYQTLSNNMVKKLDENKDIPMVDGNMDYERYKQWLSEGNTPEPEFTDAEIIATAKQTKRAGLEASCETEIIGGFSSSALGTEHWYKSELTDQLNIVGVVAGGADGYFKAGVKDAQGIITWDWVLHTAQQLKAVLGDGAMVKITLLQKLTVLKAQIDLATTQAQIESATW